jgi:hypothetical protein
MSTVSSNFSETSIQTIFDLMEQMSEADPSFKVAIDRIIKGEESEKVVAEILCDGDMNKIVEANIKGSEESGGIEEVFVDIGNTKIFKQMLDSIEDIEKQHEENGKLQI